MSNGYTNAPVWPDEMVELLKLKLQAGLSYSQIATAINGSGRWPKLQKTRNAVLGKALRDGLTDLVPFAGSKHSRGKGTNATVRDKSGRWTPPLDAHILKLYGEGLRPAVIADAMNAGFAMDITYHHVRHRLTALGVFEKAGPRRTDHPARQMGHPYPHQTKGGPSAGFIPQIVEASPETSVLSHDTDPAKHCQWPTSDGARAMHVCGQTIVQGAYCARHAEIAYRQLPTPRRNAGFHRRNQFDFVS